MMNAAARHPWLRSAATLVAIGWAGAAGPPAWAQDSFGPAPPPRSSAAPTPQTQTQTQTSQPSPTSPSVPPARSTPGADSGETQDFGVAATAQLRPTSQLHGPTPTSIPGGRVVGTRQLAQWMQGQRDPNGKVMLLHAIGMQDHLPLAIPVVPASQGGSFKDQVQTDFGRYLQQATGGDRSRLLVTYCAGVQCWGSYNAALRAIHMGYSNVWWYRGGVEAWRAAGMPVLNDADNASAQPR